MLTTDQKDFHSNPQDPKHLLTQIQKLALSDENLKQDLSQLIRNFQNQNNSDASQCGNFLQGDSLDSCDKNLIQFLLSILDQVLMINNKSMLTDLTIDKGDNLDISSFILTPRTQTEVTERTIRIQNFNSKYGCHYGKYERRNQSFSPKKIQRQDQYDDLSKQQLVDDVNRIFDIMEEQEVRETQTRRQELIQRQQEQIDVFDLGKQNSINFDERQDSRIDGQVFVLSQTSLMDQNLEQNDDQDPLVDKAKLQTDIVSDDLDQDQNQENVEDLKQLEVALMEEIFPSKVKKDIDGFVTVRFQVTYETQYGQYLCVIGDNNQLGSWTDIQKNVMQWNEGHKWSLKVNMQQHKKFEYKYVVVADGKAQFWEQGKNRKVQVIKQDLFQYDQFS